MIASAPGVDDPRVPEAFGNVPRERLVGGGPWKALQGEGYVESPDADPTFLYEDVVVAYLRARPGATVAFWRAAGNGWWIQ